MPPGRDIGRKPPVERHSWNKETACPPGCKRQPPYALSPSQLVAVFSSASLEKSQPWQYLLTMCLCHLKATEIKKDQNNPYHCQRPPLMLLILCQTLHVISGMIHRIASSPRGMHPEMDDYYLNENPRAGHEHAERNTEALETLGVPTLLWAAHTAMATVQAHLLPQGLLLLSIKLMEVVRQTCT